MVRWAGVDLTRIGGIDVSTALNVLAELGTGLSEGVRISVCERIGIHGHALMINRSWNCKANCALAACQ